MRANNPTEHELLNDYSGKPIAPILAIVGIIIGTIIAGTHIFMYIIEKLCN